MNHQKTTRTPVQHCDCKGTALGYCPPYDAHYCAGCGAWAEGVCDRPGCVLCAPRPANAFGEDAARRD